MRLIDESHINSPKWQTLCLAAIRRLCDQVRLDGSAQVKNVKVKWNVCHAIGAVMKNTVMFQLSDKDFDWVVRMIFLISGMHLNFKYILKCLMLTLFQQHVFVTLSRLIIECTNFKVRINGAAALAVPNKRVYYGKHFFEVWRALSTALYQANNLSDFNEYNHRDNLLDQVRLLFFGDNHFQFQAESIAITIKSFFSFIPFDL